LTCIDLLADSSVSNRQMFAEFLQQLPAIERFGKVVVAACFETLLVIALPRVGRQCDYGCCQALAPENPRGFIAVHVRHLDVHKYQVEFPGESFLYRLISICCDCHFQTHLLEK